MSAPRPLVLIILDGWGYREETESNAIALAHKPHWNHLWADYPHTLISGCGRCVGLPDGQMGNSEVGHLNIGAGRVVHQDLTRIDLAIEDKSFFENPVLVQAVQKAITNNKAIHILGLVSPGGIHSHELHIQALLDLAAQQQAPHVYIHAFLDGRDTPPRSALSSLEKLMHHCAQIKCGTIASVIGRYYAMDRDKRWDRVAKAYNAIVEAEGPRFADPQAAIADAYAHDVSDEFVVPSVIGNYDGIKDGDGVLCFNFRADRVREILDAMLDPSFAGFPRKRNVRFAAAVGMTQYSEELDRLLDAIFPSQTFPNILGEVASAANRTQLRMAETEKYPHVTYFLNGGREEPFPGEDRIMVPSPKVATYDLQPEMSAPELTAKAVEAIDSGKYDLIVLNYANADMVGHTGNLKAAIKAVETVDTGLGKIADAIDRSGGALLVTADHGNCEMMRDPATGGPHTAHTTNPVPLLLQGGGGASLADGRLADLAPTLLELMQLPKPAEMTGVSLLRPHKSG